jgi:hypothetical protein
MKQHITIDELNNLTAEQTERLREWWNPKLGDFYYDTVTKTESLFDYDMENEFKENNREYRMRPLLSIGQMIELIQDKKPLLKGISKNRFDKWFINIDNGMLGYKDELCDALWETVKQLLKG